MKKPSLALLKKYNVQGPRYTSYPPAPSWKKELGSADYEKVLAESNQAETPAPLSLYFHLPFCESLCYFCGCHTKIVGQNRSFENPYLEALQQEIEWCASRLDKKRAVVQMHLGGGTPTFSSPADLEKLMQKVKDNFKFDPKAEVGIEVDPRVTTEDHLKVLSTAGFNRLSMGVQDFNPTVQEAINREQSFEKTKSVVEWGRKYGYESINMDLIYGLPHQTPASFNETIGQILELGPDRLAVYSFAYVPWLKPHQNIFDKDLPDEEVKLEIFLSALNKFLQAGFEYIGMDHFAKPDDELSRARRERTLWRNFMGYTTKSGTDLLGMGVSAISNLHGAYFQNQKELNDYEKTIAKKGAATIRGFILSKDDKVRYRVIQNLMCHATLFKSEIEREFGINFDDYFKESLQKLNTAAQDGLVEITSDEIRPTDLGRIFLRNLAMAFDAYLPKSGDARVFSKTI